MGRETTLRQLVYNCVKEATRDEGLIRTELHELTEYILNNSVLELSSERLHLTEGNSLGIGENNKDKKVILPRFLSFNFSKKNIFQLLNNNSSRTWQIRTYYDFNELESTLIYNIDNKLVVIIDGEITDYELKSGQQWGWEVIWDCDAYIVTYFLDNIEEREVFKSRIQVKNRLLELTEQGADEIVAYNIIEGKSMDFVINQTLYSTRPSEDDAAGLLWLGNDDDFDEEEEVF